MVKMQRTLSDTYDTVQMLANIRQETENSNGAEIVPKSPLTQKVQSLGAATSSSVQRGGTMQSRSPLFSKVDSQSSSGIRTHQQEDIMGSHNSSFDVTNGNHESHQNYELSEEDD